MQDLSVMGVRVGVAICMPNPSIVSEILAFIRKDRRTDGHDDSASDPDQ